MKTCRCGAAISDDGPGLCLPCFEAEYPKALPVPTPGRLRKIVALYRQGMSVKRIASSASICAASVRATIRAYEEHKESQR
jgi:hypothetical protein